MDISGCSQPEVKLLNYRVRLEKMGGLGKKFAKPREGILGGKRGDETERSLVE
jgi:hypothetical protein